MNFSRNGFSRSSSGEYPGSRDEAAAKTELKALIEAGVTCFVDLTEADGFAGCIQHMPHANIAFYPS